MTITPPQLVTKCRQRYNSVGDTFYADEELYQFMYEACLEMARECMMIERVFTTASVVSQQEYPYPTQAIAPKRITYDGKRLERIIFRQDDELTFFDEDTTQEGEPNNYFVWNNTVYLRPVPDTAGLEIKVYTFNEPQDITALSSFEIPSQWVPSLIDYVVAGMAAKEKNWDAVSHYTRRWEQTVTRAKQWSRKAKTRDTYNCVRDEESFYDLPGVR